MTTTFARWCLLQLSLAAQARRAARLAAETPRPTRTHEFTLARDQGSHITFAPAAPGYVEAHASWEGSAALKVQLVRPDGSVAADAIGVGQVTLLFNVRRGEFAKNRGKEYRVVLLHAVKGETAGEAGGTLRVTTAGKATPPVA